MAEDCFISWLPKFRLAECLSGFPSHIFRSFFMKCYKPIHIINKNTKKEVELCISGKTMNLHLMQSQFRATAHSIGFNKIAFRQFIYCCRDSSVLPSVKTTKMAAVQ
jgi:hypothetical protein